MTIKSAIEASDLWMTVGFLVDEPAAAGAFETHFLLLQIWHFPELIYKVYSSKSIRVKNIRHTNDLPSLFSKCFWLWTPFFQGFLQIFPQFFASFHAFFVEKHRGWTPSSYHEMNERSLRRPRRFICWVVGMIDLAGLRARPVETGAFLHGGIPKWLVWSGKSYWHGVLNH